MKKNRTKNSVQPSAVLISSVKRILRPLVGFLMDNGLTHKWMVRVLKEVYVEVAQDEFSIEDKPLTMSRISLITGVHRKDVAAFLKDGGLGDQLPETTILSSRILAKWVGDKKYCNKNGTPKPLARLSKDGQEASFEELITSVSTDIRPRSILDEWNRLELIEINAKDQVVLKTGAFLPTKDHDQKLYFLGKNVSDHLSAARINTQSESPPFLERSVYYDQLSDESIEQLEQLSREHAMEMLTAINSAALELQQKDQKLNKRKRNG